LQRSLKADGEGLAARAVDHEVTHAVGGVEGCPRSGRTQKKQKTTLDNHMIFFSKNLRLSQRKSKT
jgi:hypothetical protein